jgi:hypothetical protein
MQKKELAANKNETLGKRTSSSLLFFGTKNSQSIVQQQQHIYIYISTRINNYYFANIAIKSVRSVCFGVLKLRLATIYVVEIGRCETNNFSFSYGDVVESSVITAKIRFKQRKTQ